MQPKHPLVVWMRGRGSKGLKSLHLGPPWASLLFVQNVVSPAGPLAPTPHSVRTPTTTTTNAQLLSLGLCRYKSTPTCPRRSERYRPSSPGRALASGGQALMARRPCSRCSTTASWSGAWPRETQSRSRAHKDRDVAQGSDRGCGPRRGLGGRAVHGARPGLRQGRLDQPAAALVKEAPRHGTAQVGETTPPALVLRRQDQGLPPLKHAAARRRRGHPRGP